MEKDKCLVCGKDLSKKRRRKKMEVVAAIRETRVECNPRYDKSTQSWVGPWHIGPYFKVVAIATTLKGAKRLAGKDRGSCPAGAKIVRHRGALPDESIGVSIQWRTERTV